MFARSERILFFCNADFAVLKDKMMAATYGLSPITFLEEAVAVTSGLLRSSKALSAFLVMKNNDLIATFFPILIKSRFRLGPSVEGDDTNPIRLRSVLDISLAPIVNVHFFWR